MDTGIQSSTTACQRIEEAALNAWPALNTLLYDGWLLRLANGYTKRANSVTPLFPGTIGMLEKITYCEMFYRQRNMQPVFRLPSFLDTKILDETLAAKHYEHIDSTQVQFLDLRDASFNFSPHAAVLVGQEGIRAWLNAFHQLNKQRKDDQTHEKMLNKITGQVGAVILTVENEIVACGLGVIEDQYLGLFDIVTADDQRRKGYGTILTQSLISWGQHNGARCAYLQVMENNDAANRLYSRMGFQECYRYWYRVAPV